MKIQYLNGGLANQAFQYIFARFAELSDPAGEPWYFDDSFFFTNHVHNGYELESVFGIQPKLLSGYFDPDVWEYLIERKRNGISIPQSILELSPPLTMIAEFENYKEHNPFTGKVVRIPGNQFLPEIASLPSGNYYYHGYWLHSGWFYSCRDLFLEELAFPPIMDKLNQQYAGAILSSESIGVHIRRGDYVSLNFSLDAEWYKLSMTRLTTEHPDASFYIFSDDIEWCREHAAELGFNLAERLVYIKGNLSGNNYIDMQLMSLCKGLLLSNSAFCYLAALLDRRLAYCMNPTRRIIKVL